MTTTPPPGGPPAPSPVFLVMTLGRRWRDRVDTVLRSRELSLRHVSALGHLAGEPGLSYSELARRAGITAQSVQATLRQLEELGAVERRTAPGRGRRAELHVTPRGDELRTWARDVVADADRAFLDAVPPDGRDGLVAGLLAAFLAAPSDAGGIVTTDGEGGTPGTAAG